MTIVFSNDVNGFVLGDIEITGDAVVLSSTLLGTGSTYMLNITPDENTDGDVTINVPAGVAQDAAGKSNAASVPQTIAVAPKWMPEAEAQRCLPRTTQSRCGYRLHPTAAARHHHYRSGDEWHD